MTGAPRRARSARVTVIVVVAVLAGWLGLTACPSATVRGGAPLDGLVARLDADRAARQRLSATLKARAPGLTGILASTDLDVAVERPRRVHLSARSFFGNPVLLVVTDGTTLSLFDGRDDPPRWSSGPLDDRALRAVTALPLDADDLVDVLLGASPRLPPDAVVEDRGATARVTGARDDGVAVTVDVRREDDAVLAVTLGRPPERVDVGFADHRRVEGGHWLPARITIRWPGPGRVDEVGLTVVEASLNGPALDAAAFTLAVPDDVTPAPL